MESKSILDKPPSKVNIVGKQYVVDGQIIPVKRKQSRKFSPEKRAEVVTAYLSTGSLAMTVAATGIARDTIKTWRTHQWWKELEQAIRDEENLHLDVKLSKVVGKTLDLLEDRIDKGDFLYDPKQGKLVRKPLNAHVANQILSNSFDKRQILRGKRREEDVNSIRAEDFLQKLAAEFARIAKRDKEVITVTEIKELEDAREVRSDQESDVVERQTIESSQNQSSEDLQCDSQAGASTSDRKTQGEVNEVSGKDTDRGSDVFNFIPSTN